MKFSCLIGMFLNVQKKGTFDADLFNEYKLTNNLVGSKNDINRQRNFKLTHRN